MLFSVRCPVEGGPAAPCAARRSARPRRRNSSSLRRPVSLPPFPRAAHVEHRTFLRTFLRSPPHGSRWRAGGGWERDRLTRHPPTAESKNNRKIGNYWRVIGTPTVVVSGPLPSPARPPAPRAAGP